MQLTDERLLHSASDLVNFLACRHLTALEFRRAHGQVPDPPKRAADTADLVARKGEEFEQRHLETMRAEHGDALVEIETGPGYEKLLEAAAITREAMKDGVPVVYQATFVDGDWMGYVDFLERVETPSELGRWSYEPADTKLARSLKPYFVIQLCLYADLIERVQGRRPDHVHVILGNGERRTLAHADFRAYFTRMKELYLGTLGAELDGTYPDPVAHCELCNWAEPCEQRRVSDDHLSLVAKLGGAQAAKLREGGIETVETLAAADVESRPNGMTASTFERLHSQASLQMEERRDGQIKLQRLPPEPIGAGPLRGFARMPAPSPGDIFFDIEGDPFYDEGLEYLWGATYLEDDVPTFKAFWGTDRGGEKTAFEGFVDFVFERRERFPEMHVYHYAPYERTALARMMGLHGSRENEVDRMLREHVLVDLYRVVDQALRISRPSYSLKEVEAFYDQGRTAEVKQAGDSVLMFEQWLQEGDAELLSKIEDYNKEDCDSTLRLRDWLIEQRELTEREHGLQLPWRSPGQPTEPDDGEEDVLGETSELQETLLKDVPPDPDDRSASQREAWLLAQLLDYHRREAKPAWWQWFERLERTSAELAEFDSEAIGELSPTGDADPLPKPSRSFVQRFSFPAQDHKVRAGKFADPHSCGIDPETGESDHKAKNIDVVNVDDAAGELRLKLSKARLADPPKALIPGKPYGTNEQRGALRDVAADVIASSSSDRSRFRAAGDILGRRRPRTSAVAHGEALQGEEADLEQIKAVAAGLEESYLFIQGPPGSGKTYTGAHLILDLIAAGKRVGVTSNSHKAINNLLAEVERFALSGKVAVRGLKKWSSSDQEYVPPDADDTDPMIGNSKDNADFGPDAEQDLLAGTAWLWCREEMRQSVDYLIIDEAGQVSLADALALSTAGTNLILLGDPQQLAQVSQGTHPPGSGVSALEHLLGDHGTIPADRGIFLEHSRRMHPDVCEFVSEAIYEGRLRPAAGCERQRIDAPGALTGTGVRSIPIEHTGNSRQSPEEAERIGAEVADLLRGQYTNAKGDQAALSQDEIMVVTPYNAQVRTLRQQLDSQGFTEVAVGTVDKFQGQEAAVVFFSMATSSGAEIPRNVDFLYSRNRLNVAISRARCLAVLVASPALMTIECATVEQMRLVNALCLLDEMGTGSG
ncbi:MAG TPA: TM0106 family RecB-like putative nuclease [Solirubrobacterales bacterium]|nr:TM0106 family RecB-like putative nuclease [Solirubrobacterales bacterium]